MVLCLLGLTITGCGATAPQPMQGQVLSPSEMELGKIEARVDGVDPDKVEVELSWTVSIQSGPPFALADAAPVWFSNQITTLAVVPRIDGRPVQDQAIHAGEAATLRATFSIARAVWDQGCWQTGHTIAGDVEVECINEPRASAD